MRSVPFTEVRVVSTDSFSGTSVWSIFTVSFPGFSSGNGFTSTFGDVFVFTVFVHPTTEVVVSSTIIVVVTTFKTEFVPSIKGFGFNLTLTVVE